jgi:hypothetical protein
VDILLFLETENEGEEMQMPERASRTADKPPSHPRLLAPCPLNIRALSKRWRTPLRRCSCTIRKWIRGNAALGAAAWASAMNADSTSDPAAGSGDGAARGVGSGDGAARGVGIDDGAAVGSGDGAARGAMGMGGGAAAAAATGATVPGARARIGATRSAVEVRKGHPPHPLALLP